MEHKLLVIDDAWHMEYCSNEICEMFSQAIKVVLGGAAAMVSPDLEDVILNEVRIELEKDQCFLYFSGSKEIFENIKSVVLDNPDTLWAYSLGYNDAVSMFV